ncbi:hypothetical protein DHEL01_v200182 [Diaporthe helianthi]|uniref:Uncharacterized protein n=1 Tax=Diaporthe helianthi TaxID=158607 RepID=A0A2P5IG25_DIAHE|nr:hypothetical protein DHEL01_v200182 [Diaporthe helianthi]
MATPSSLLPAGPSDAEAIACGVDVPSMLNGPLFQTMFPTYRTMSPEEREEMMQWYITGLEDALLDPGDEFYLKACLSCDGNSTGTKTGDSNESVLPVGFCGWEVIDKAKDSALQSHKQQQQQQQQQQGNQQEGVRSETSTTNANTTAKKQRGNQLPETLDVEAWLSLSNRLRKERTRFQAAQHHEYVAASQH